GTRFDIVELSSSLRGRYGRVSGPAITRLQRLATQRLATHQLDLRNPLDRPAIERLIGSASYRLLTATGKRAPLLRSYVHCLDALDAVRPPDSRPVPAIGSPHPP